MIEQSQEIHDLPRRDFQLLRARYNNHPIAEHTDDWFRTEWPQKVMMWVKMLGIRSKDGKDILPDHWQDSLLMDFLINEYGGMTFEELEVAFRMNMLGELGAVIEHYNELNVKFLTQIVNSYKAKRIEADNKYKDICHKLQYLPAPVEDPALADYYSGKSIYLKYKGWQQGLPVIGLHADYKFLMRIGILQDDPALMSEAIAFAQEGIKQDFEQDLTDKHSLGAFLTNDKLLEQSIEQRAKAYLVVELFERLKSGGTDFQALLRKSIHDTHPPRTPTHNT